MIATAIKAATIRGFLFSYYLLVRFNLCYMVRSKLLDEPKRVNFISMTIKINDNIKQVRVEVIEKNKNNVQRASCISGYICH